MYAEITCNQTGHGITLNHISSDTTQIILSESDLNQFPSLQQDDFFYVFITNCKKCEQVKVISRNNNILLIERSKNAECFPIGSHINYDGRSPQAIRAITLSEFYKFDPPLLQNEATRTVSISKDYMEQLVRKIVTDILNI